MPRSESSGSSRNRRGSSRSDSGRRSFDDKKGPSANSSKRPNRNKPEGSGRFKKSGSDFSKGEGSKSFSGKRPSAGGKRFGGSASGDDKPRFRKSDSQKPSYGRSQSGDDKPRFRKSDSQKPSYGSSQAGDDKPRFRKSDSEKPSFDRKQSSGDKPRFRKSDSEKPSFDRKQSGDEKPSRFKNFNIQKPFSRRSDSDSDKPENKLRSSDPDKKFTRKKDSEGESSSRPARSGSFTKKFDESPRERKSPFRKNESSSDYKKGFSEKRKDAGAPERTVEGHSAPVQSEKIRLNKYIANSGVCSRREADELIKMGLISVNGKTITELGYKVDPGDEVRHESKVLKSEKLIYILMNKPKGYLTTTADPQERNTVMHIIGNSVKERIYPVGRLDRNTTGLLLLTNDGDLADKLMHPSYNAKKIYKAELDKPITKADLDRIMDGVQLEEGKALVDDVAVISEDRKTVGLEIHIGWNRVVRRIFEALDYQVVKLDRSMYAGLDKKELPRGHWRALRKDEVVRLKHFNS